MPVCVLVFAKCEQFSVSFGQLVVSDFQCLVKYFITVLKAVALWLSQTMVKALDPGSVATVICRSHWLYQFIQTDKITPKIQESPADEHWNGALGQCT